MGKGKGSQCGYFARKSLKAQYRREWQDQVTEDQHRRHTRRKQYKKTQQKKAAENKVRPKLRLTSLLRVIEERRYHDQIEDRTVRQRKNKTSIGLNQKPLSPPGSIVYYKDSEYGKDVRDGRILPSLQTICLKSLATSLPLYVKECDEETLHHYLSLFTGPALTALSVYISETIGMSDSLIGLFNQSHVTRLSIYAPKNDEETDRNWKALTKVGLESLAPSFGNNNNNNINRFFADNYIVRDSWEDYIDEGSSSSDNNNDDLWQWKGCRKLERLELGNMPYMQQSDGIETLLSSCSSLTHLTLCSCCTFESGPEILWKLHTWLPQLQFLDLSGNGGWVTEELLRNLFLLYTTSNATTTQEGEEEGTFDFDDYDNDTNNNNNRQNRIALQIKAIGCLSQTSEISLEMEFGNLFIYK